jgi:hypothetical protein
MVTNQKVLSNRASNKSRVHRVGSIMTAVLSAFPERWYTPVICEGLGLYNAERRCVAAKQPLAYRASAEQFHMITGQS